MIWRRALLGEGCRRLAAGWVRRGVLVATACGRWGKARQVPGLAALNARERRGHLTVVRAGRVLRATMTA
jgi:hypothetical protein